MQITMRALILNLVLIAFAPLAHALDGMSLELGTSDSSHSSVDLGRVGLQWNWATRFAVGSDWHVGGHWDLSLAYWNNDSPAKTNSSLTDLGITPVLRLEANNPGAVSPFVDFGVGAHFLSETSVSPERRFGSSFQFGSLIGLGMSFGPQRAFDLSYRYQHLSNAGIKAPNQGINFHLLRLGYRF
jgi:lipid A 3-O-deacylase